MPELALHGGPAAAADLDVPDWPRATDGGRANVLDAFESGAWCRLDEGAGWVERFEEAFADFHGAEHAIATANGTVAIELALRACGVEPGDEVIVPAYTFIATASAVLDRGAIPRFADVDPDTYNLDPGSVAERITDDTAAVVGVHFAGRPFDVDALLPVVEDRDLRLIEDCAHAQGAAWRGERVGTFGDAGAFSFQSTKSLAAGEGGIVVTDDPSVGAEARLLHDVGRREDAPGFEHHAHASDYRLGELQGALLCDGLERFPDENERRARGEERLRRRLADLDGIAAKPRDDRITERGYCPVNLTYDPEAGGAPRDRVLEALRAEGVPAGPGYGLALYDQPAFDPERVRPLLPPGADVPDYHDLRLPGAERVAARTISLPHQVLLADGDGIDALADAIHKVVAGAETLAEGP